MQHWDDELGRSKLEGSGDHEHANQTALLIGHHIARYWFADGIRGVDYLIARPDVIADRIGTFGCSGGGTAAAYLAAMEPRIHVAAAASYLTSFKELLPGNGPQDAEQTLSQLYRRRPGLCGLGGTGSAASLCDCRIRSRLLPDRWRKWTFEEARRIYSLYGMEKQPSADPRPGRTLQSRSGHGSTYGIYHVAFVPRRKTEAKKFQQLRLKNFDKLIVTPTGQVSTSLDCLTVEALARRDATKLMAEYPDDLESRLALAIANEGSG